MKSAVTILLLVQLLAKCLAVPHGHGWATCPTDSDDHHSRLHLHVAPHADHAHDHHHHPSNHNEPGDSTACDSPRRLIESPVSPHDQDAVYLGSETFVAPQPRISVAACGAWMWLTADVEGTCERFLPRNIIARAAGPPGGLAGSHFRYLPHVLSI